MNVLKVLYIHYPKGTPIKNKINSNYHEIILTNFESENIITLIHTKTI